MNLESSKNISLKTEVVAGLTTFFTMAYIIVVNPAILSGQGVGTGTGMAASGVMTATVLLGFTMTLLMGLYAKLPFAVAPGMGLNAFFAFSIVMGRQVPWPAALGIIFWAGVLFLLVSLTPLRIAIANAIPAHLRHATAVGIGLFISFIGLKNAGFVVSDPVTFVKLGKFTPQTFLALSALLIMYVLMKRKSPFAFLGGMAVMTLIGLLAGYVQWPGQVVSAPDFDSVFLKLDLWGSLKLAYVPAMVSILFTDLFDSISTFIGVSYSAKMLDESGQPLRLREGLIVDAWATLVAGLVGTSSGTAYIESAAGIQAGGRSGWTSVVTALCFLPFLFLSPLVQMVPAFATAPVLILVGALMFRSLKELRITEPEDLIPSFFTVILIPLTFSITQGILWGFMAHAVLYVLAGRGREVTKTMYALAVLSAVLLVIEH